MQNDKSECNLTMHIMGRRGQATLNSKEHHLESKHLLSVRTLEYGHVKGFKWVVPQDLFNPLRRETRVDRF